MNRNGENLVRSVRRRLGMTQEQFAEEIGVTVSTVNRWEESHPERNSLAWRTMVALARRWGLIDLQGAPPPLPFH